MKTAAWIISVFLVLTITGYGWAQAPVPISPGTPDGKGLVISGCPTFSWAEVTEATGYKVVVFTHDAAELLLYFEDIAATQIPTLEHDIPVRALSWTPSADQGLCAGIYVWYVAAVQWGEVLEWSEGRVFTVDALTGLDAAVGKCVGVPADIAGTDNHDAKSEEVAIESGDASGALNLEQVISSEVADEHSLKSTERDGTFGGASTIGPITMGIEGPSNTLYGSGAGASLTDHRGVTFIGVDAGAANTTGVSNTFVGLHAGRGNMNGNGNTFIGLKAGESNIVGNSNTFVGLSAGAANAAGNDNTFLGMSAGASNITGHYNAFIGRNAGFSNNSGGLNTFVGWGSGESNTTASNNTFLGFSSGASNSTGEHNTFIGLDAGFSNTGGYSNTFVGRGSGYSNTTSNSNTFIGMNTGHSNTIGYYNTFIGQGAGYFNTTGTSNTFLGEIAGMHNTTGHSNTFLGMSAGYNNEAGSYSVFIGYRAGYNETGSNKLYIDNSDTDTPLIYGEFDNDLVKIHGELQMIAAAGPSDKRLKKDIKPLQSSLDKIQLLEGVSYHWKTEEYPEWGFKETKQIGLVAQNVEDVIPELVSTDSKGYKAVSYDKLTAVLVEAVKELRAENDQLKAKMEELRNLIME